MNWSAQIDFDSVCRRAAGRRRYNAGRRAEAKERYKLVVEAILSPDGRKRGSQTKLAQALGVHRSTISRDMAKWRQTLLDAIRILKAKNQLSSTSSRDNSDLRETLP